VRASETAETAWELIYTDVITLGDTQAARRTRHVSIISQSSSCK